MPNGRCRLHGGASPGAPNGKANGNYRHGRSHEPPRPPPDPPPPVARTQGAGQNQAGSFKLGAYWSKTLQPASSPRRVFFGERSDYPTPRAERQVLRRLAPGDFFLQRLKKGAVRHRGSQIVSRASHFRKRMAEGQLVFRIEDHSIAGVDG